ncbi:MAG: DUF4190 domain-containing protein [Nocardioides sp.]
MTTGPENPYGEQPPQQPNPYYPQQPAPPPYGQSYPQQGYDQNMQGQFMTPQQQYGQQPYGQPPYHRPAPPNDGLGIASMVVGIVSLVLMCGYGIGLLGAPAALIMGRISMKRIDRSDGTLGGRGFAQAGFILGIIGTVLLVLALVSVAIVVFAGVNGAFDDPGYSSY